MNTGKQINAMVVVLLLTVISLGAYALFDDFRAETAEDDQLLAAAERGANTFALNCRLCHGDRGEGGANGGRLPAAPPLDSSVNQGIENGSFSLAAFEERFKFISNTIMCGRAGTFMPTWGRSQGGTLSDEQIRQLAVLISGGEPDGSPYHEGAFWELAQEHADEIDAMATEHAELDAPVSAQAAELVVSNAAPFATGQYIRIDDERLQVLEKQLIVTRGVDGTEAAEHESGTEFLRDGEHFDEVLADGVDAEATSLVVSDIREFSIGETLGLDDELVRVTDIRTGVPTTGHLLAKDIGREPHEFLVGGSAGIEIGEIIRIDGELMEVLGVRDDGDAGIALDGDVSATADLISVTDASFFADDYYFRVDGELIEVLGPVDTEQTLGDTIGRAETSFTVSGTLGLEEGMVIRMGRELMRIVSLQPATVTIERGTPGLDGQATQAAPHPAGTPILKLVEVDEEGNPLEDPEAGQELLEGLNSSATAMTVSGTSGLAIDDTFQIGGELVLVTGIESATVVVERAVGGSKAAFHSRRVPIYEGNLLEVVRGAQGTTPAAHSDGAEVFLDVLEVERAVGDSELQDHSKDAEIFIGNGLNVERGVLDTDAAEHADGTLVLNFPPPPDAPARTGNVCGQIAPAETTPSGEQPTPIEGAQDVAVSLSEYSVTPEVGSIAATAANFVVTNDGSIAHNFRVIATDLAPDALPVVSFAVDEEQVEVVGGFTEALNAGDTRNAGAELAPGNYVLICNVPQHYELGMYAGFTVTAP